MVWWVDGVRSSFPVASVEAKHLIISRRKPEFRRKGSAGRLAAARAPVGRTHVEIRMANRSRGKKQQRRTGLILLPRGLSAVLPFTSNRCKSIHTVEGTGTNPAAAGVQLPLIIRGLQISCCFPQGGLAFP